MTTEQKAKAWDLFKQSTHNCANSKDFFIKRDVKSAAKDIFKTLCEAEMIVQERFPDLGKEKT